MKKIRAIAFDTAQEINTLVLVLSKHITTNKERMIGFRNHDVKKLLSTAREVQQMFINPNNSYEIKDDRLILKRKTNEEK